MSALYSLIYFLALIFILPGEFLKRPKRLRRRWLRDKLGDISISLSGNVLWVHAVSVGEVGAAVPFVKALKLKYPGLGFIVSTITDTGQAAARERLSDIAEICYLPFDIGFILKRALRKNKVILFITVETEIWPGAIRAMKKSGAHVAVVNGRISGGSYSGYRKIRFFIKRVLGQVDLFCMQDDVYAGRIIGLGAPRDSVKVTGNFKFDINSSGRVPGWGERIAGLTIIAGSTHRGEEELILSAYLKLKHDFPGLNLIIAPRHPERFKEVVGLILGKGVELVKASGINGKGDFHGSVIVLDLMGELFGAYSFSDIAIIGGSFIRHGGQSPLEAAYWQKAIVCGPHMENFPFVEEFFAGGGAVRSSPEDLYPVLRDLLNDEERRTSMGRKAKEICSRKTGAVDKAVAELDVLISKHGTP